MPSPPSPSACRRRHHRHVSATRFTAPKDDAPYDAITARVQHTARLNVPRGERRSTGSHLTQLSSSSTSVGTSAVTPRSTSAATPRRQRKRSYWRSTETSTVQGDGQGHGHGHGHGRRTTQHLGHRCAAGLHRHSHRMSLQHTSERREHLLCSDSTSSTNRGKGRE